MKKPDLKTLNKEQLEYVKQLEDWISNFKLSNLYKLVTECDNAMGVIADDIKTIANKGDDDEIENQLQMLGSSKNKVYDKFLSLIGQIKHFKSLSDMIEEMKPKISDVTHKEEVIVEEKKKSNIQDFVVK